MDGPWQLGHKSADEYGRLAADTGRALHQFDKTLELVACGSSGRRMPTFASWEAAVLDHAYDEVDFISAHVYYENDKDLGSFLASTVGMDNFIDDVITAADYVRARKNKTKRINISVDEWNVWYVSEVSHEVGQEWQVAPRISEQAYTVADAVVVGSMLITLLRHSDRVTSACLAQLVNTIAPIRSEPNGPSWRQTTFFPFALTQQHARGDVLRVEPQCPTYTTALHGDVPVVDAVATRDPDDGAVSVFVVNRHPEEALRLRLGVAGLGDVSVVEALTMADADPLATNSQQHTDRIVPRETDTSLTEDGLYIDLPAVSWSCIRLTAGGAGASDIVS